MTCWGHFDPKMALQFPDTWLLLMWRAHRKALAVLGLVGDVDEEGDDGGVAPHQAHDRVQRQVHALDDHALAPGLARAYEPVQALQHHPALRLVGLRRRHTRAPGGCVANRGCMHLRTMWQVTSRAQSLQSADAGASKDIGGRVDILRRWRLAFSGEGLPGCSQRRMQEDAAHASQTAQAPAWTY